MQRLIILFITALPLLVTTFVSGSGVDEYTKAISQSPEDMKFKFYILRGKAYGDQCDFDAAIKDFGISIQMHPSYDGYLNRGRMYFQKGAYNIAEQDFSKAIEMNPLFEAYRLRGITYLILGKLDMAVADGTEIIKLAPNTSEAYNIRMEAYGQIGEPQLAREDARRALSLDRRNSVAAEILVRYPEKIELTGGASRYRPKGDISKYRVWANSKGYAFTKKSGDEQSGK